MSQQRPRDLLEFLRRTSSSIDESERRVDGPQRSLDSGATQAGSQAAQASSQAAQASSGAAQAKTRRPPKKPLVETPERSDTPHVNVSQGDTPLVVLRRSQVIVAGIAAGLLIVLAYLLGSMLGGEESTDQPVFADVGVYTIAVIEYHDDAHGQISAKMLKADLAKLDWDEVLIEQLDRDRRLWVTIGSWVSNPRTNRQAMSMLSEVKKLRVQGSDKYQFADARFVRIKR